MNLKTIDLTVLFVDTIPARIYLALLKKNGYKPKALIFLDIRPESKKYAFVEKVIGAYLSGILLNIFKKIKGIDKIAESALGHELLEINDLSETDLKSCLDMYKDKDISRMVVNGINDKKLASHLEFQLGAENTILFTGGGILRGEILDIENIKFIHIHPGIVPEIRGADCLYWSLLLRNKAGYSAFYMNKGIDTGDIITTNEYIFNLSKINLDGYSNNELYTALLTYYDPVLRIKTFIDFIKEDESVLDDLYDLPYIKQKKEEGRMYFYMHDELRNFVLNQVKKGTS